MDITVTIDQMTLHYLKDDPFLRLYFINILLILDIISEKEANDYIIMRILSTKVDQLITKAGSL